MLATAAQSLPSGLDGWITEFKWDGMRCCLAIHRGRVRAWSRAGNDITSRFPELAAIGQLPGPSKVLDGELVVAGGRPDFGMLQRRMHVTQPGPPLLPSAPVTLIAFDLLQIGTRTLTGNPSGSAGCCWAAWTSVRPA